MCSIYLSIGTFDAFYNAPITLVKTISLVNGPSVNNYPEMLQILQLWKTKAVQKGKPFE